jgi:hypothetical protein
MPRDPQSQAKLGQALSALALTPPTGKPPSPLAGRISSKTFKLDSNELGLQRAMFEFGKEGCRFTFKDSQHEYPIACGVGRWQRGETALPGTPPRLISGGAPKSGMNAKLAASGAWTDDNTFQMVMRYYETPHHDTLTCRFDESSVQISFMNSMAQMSPTPKDKRPVLEGKLVG